MRIFHNTFRADGVRIAQKEITSISPENKARKERYEKQMANDFKGCFFCLSCEAEEGDGENYENVPAWKQIAAAEIIKQAKDMETAAKLGKPVGPRLH